MRTHVEEEIYILGPTLLERPRGLLRLELALVFLEEERVMQQ